MTKTDKVKAFLQGKTFAGCSQAHQQYELLGESITYPQFNSIWRTCLKEGTVTHKEDKVVVSQGEVPEEEKEEITLYTPDEIENMFDESILVPLKSGTIFDNIISKYGGTLPATIAMVPGESGVGKTSVLMHYLAKIKQHNKKARILFVSTEMNKIHQYKYQRRIKLAGVVIEILFLGEYDYPHDVLERVLEEGYDIVLIDSFQDCVDQIQDAGGFGTKAGERWLIKLMDRIRLGKNKAKKYTAFICTQHMTKGGTYTGSTKVKHMTDSMMMLRFDGEGSTYIEFNKNRDGSVRIQLYYKISDDGVIFDEERFKSEEQARFAAQKEIARRHTNNDAFDEIFKINQPEETVEEVD